MEVVYWDASAIVSALFKDKYSDRAQEWANKEGVHLVSTLAYAETCAVCARMKKQHLVANVLSKAAMDVLNNGPWYRLTAYPEWGLIESLAEKWSLRGADLWHLATAKSLQEQLPELVILTFDVHLKNAAGGEGMTADL